MNSHLRADLIARINKLIAEAPTPEKRVEVAAVCSFLLHAAGQYRGFNYTEWNEGGWKRWREDGRPEDNTPYLGDQTKVTYY